MKNNGQISVLSSKKNSEAMDLLEKFKKTIDEYAISFCKNENIKKESIKRSERINIIDNEIIQVGAGALDRKISNFAKENGINTPILDAVIKRNEEIDRPEQDWKADKGRAVAE